MAEDLQPVDVLPADRGARTSKRVFAVFACAFGLYLLIQLELRHHSLLHVLGIAFVVIVLAEALAPKQMERAMMRLFGRIDYIQPHSMTFENRIRRRYHADINQLSSLGFNLLFFEGQTFSFLSLLSISPAIVLTVMLCKREVITILEGRIVVGHPIFGSPTNNAFAYPLGLGVIFHSAFDDGTLLVSTNYGDNNANSPTYVRNAYKGTSISSAWANHQSFIQSIQAGGKLVDHNMSFDKFVEIIR